MRPVTLVSLLVVIVAVGLVIFGSLHGDQLFHRGSGGLDLHPFAVEICAQLRSDSPLGYQVPGDKPRVPQYLFDGLQGAERYEDRIDPGLVHAVGIREYSDALDSVCPQTVRRFLGGQSFYDWFTD